MQACDFHCKPPTSSDLNEPDCCLRCHQTMRCLPQGSFIIAIIIAIHGSHACAYTYIFSQAARQLEMRNTRDLFFAITLVAQIPNSRARNSFLYRNASYSTRSLFYFSSSYDKKCDPPYYRLQDKIVELNITIIVRPITAQLLF